VRDQSNWKAQIIRRGRKKKKNHLDDHFDEEEEEEEILYKEEAEEDPVEIETHSLQSQQWQGKKAKEK